MIIKQPIEFKNYNKTVKENKCPICFDKFIFKERIVETSCKHIYHAECLKKAFENKSSCPICRKDFNIKEDNINNVFVDKRSIFNVIKQHIVDIYNKTEPELDSDIEDNEDDNPIEIMPYLENNPDIQQEHEQARQEMYGDEIDYDDDIIDNNNDNNCNYILTTVDNDTNNWQRIRNDNQFIEQQDDINDFDTNQQDYSQYVIEPVYPNGNNIGELHHNNYNTDSQYNTMDTTNNESIEKAIQLSKQTYQTEQEYQKQLNDILNHSLSANSINTLSNDIFDGTLNDILYQIAIEESNYNELNTLWNKKSDIHYNHNNYNEIDDCLEYDITFESDVESDESDVSDVEIDEIIKKRKSYGKNMPRLQQNNAFKNAFNVPIMT